MVCAFPYHSLVCHVSQCNMHTASNGIIWVLLTAEPFAGGTCKKVMHFCLAVAQQVDAWESQQRSYQPSLCVLQHLERAVNAACCAPDQAGGSGRAEHPAAAQALAAGAQKEEAASWAGGAGGAERGGSSGGPGAASSSGRGGAPQGGPRVRSMLLCGADMVESLVIPGVWRPEHVRAILADHGVVCIDRRAAVLSVGNMIHIGMGTETLFLVTSSYPRFWQEVRTAIAFAT